VTYGFLMQVYADVLRRPVSGATSDQAPALGSAIDAAIAAGVHADVAAASAAMGRVTRVAVMPDPARADAYDALFAEYRAVHDCFSGRGTNGTASSDVRHRLRQRRNERTNGATPA
jgi:L-ribulokinase